MSDSQCEGASGRPIKHGLQLKKKAK